LDLSVLSEDQSVHVDADVVKDRPGDRRAGVLLGD